ncbi:sulfate permease [Sulfitobacter mediterraneus]|uniref:SulP family inorganic anion transporter n=1 Tax=Sulfitobacter mediterraneus TaxID=83219 RepID=UPI001931FD3E|nr:sulfate permease [Sulfitobacter mediterraneus]MBM1633103.1 sulfate permease [Sulfitobacter mediterraneus]MBM1640763.1 sulfate permease [Sulfitobacter mediterraneus]MBM1644968.1 sulfate permease [Sulfitobacter mediterraneus]MBM1648883.1 sulfate permease [Sulfitobacter mediterraneus]MBM1652904.1 sulfate permease [Sulfitobacter mediterraneus]
MNSSLSRFLPILNWGRSYNRSSFSNDLMAAVIVTIMLIPQSLAYALLAGLPPEAGLYASILPIMLYAVFGTSRALAVGPVAVVSLMTAATLGEVAAQGSAGYAAAALTLAALSGAILLAMGLFRLGFVANFLSHPVIAGFITASGLLIAASQLKHILGIEAHGHTLLELVTPLILHLPQTNWITLTIGAGAVAFLFWVRKGLAPLLSRFGLSEGVKSALVKAGPVAVVVATTLTVWGFDLSQSGVQIVGAVPQSLPPFTLPPVPLDLLQKLLMPAFLISLIGFVESISVAQTLAAKKRQRIDPDQELIGLGAANIGAALTGGFPVTGGFSRSVVNFDAGAETPAAGAFTAIGLAIAALLLTPLIFFLPKATLAATIIVAVLSLIDFSILTRSWHYSKSDFAAVAVTILLTLGMGVEAGVTAGVLLSILLHLYKSSKPHIAEVGRVPGTEHYRNILRHKVITDPTVVSLRVDESLYFANARFLEDQIHNRVARDPAIRHVILQCSAINAIDLSALESLEMINTRLREMNVCLHLSEVKGPVMDRLEEQHFLQEMTGKVFLTQFEAAQYVASQSSTKEPS